MSNNPEVEDHLADAERRQTFDAAYDQWLAARAGYFVPGLGLDAWRGVQDSEEGAVRALAAAPAPDASAIHRKLDVLSIYVREVREMPPMGESLESILLTAIRMDLLRLGIPDGASTEGTTNGPIGTSWTRPLSPDNIVRVEWQRSLLAESDVPVRNTA